MSNSSTTVTNDPNRLTPAMRAARTYNRKVMRLARLIRQAEELAEELAEDPGPNEEAGWTRNQQHNFHREVPHYAWNLETIRLWLEAAIPPFLAP